jgi:hypothetical protein
MKPNDLKVNLSKGKVTFSFIKKDGTERTMTATTNPELIPGNVVLEQTKTDVITVWDLDKEAYRKVILDKVIF